MLDKLFRAHSEKNGMVNQMNGTASTKENPGVRRELSERPTPDMLRRTDSMTAFHAQKEFQDRTVSIGNQHQAGGNHQPPDRQQSMDNCKCTIC